MDRKLFLIDRYTELQWRRSSHKVGDASLGQQKKPESSAQGHVGVPRVSQPLPTGDEPENQAHIANSLDRSHHSSEDESDMSNEQDWSWFPDVKANDQAQWRRTALAKRANVGGTTAENTPSSKENVHFQSYGNASKLMVVFDECRESLVAASAANENSYSTQASGTSPVSVERNDETGALANQN